MYFTLKYFVQMDIEDQDDEKALSRVRQLDSEEPLLQENSKRFVVFPIKHPDVWQFYKKAEGYRPFHLVALYYCDYLQLRFGR